MKLQNGPCPIFFFFLVNVPFSFEMKLHPNYTSTFDKQRPFHNPPKKKAI